MALSSLRVTQPSFEGAANTFQQSTVDMKQEIIEPVSK